MYNLLRVLHGKLICNKQYSISVPHDHFLEQQRSVPAAQSRTEVIILTIPCIILFRIPAIFYIMLQILCIILDIIVKIITQSDILQCMTTLLEMKTTSLMIY